MFFHQILLICLAHNLHKYVASCCMLYLLDICQIDGNTTFKNEFCNWTKAMARHTLPRLHWQGLLAAKQPKPEPLEYHVWGAMLEKFQQLKQKQQNVTDLKTVLQTFWNNLSDETIHKSVFSFRKQLTAYVCQSSRQTFRIFDQLTYLVLIVVHY